MSDKDFIENREKCLLDLMIKCYEGEDQRNHDIDTKSLHMLMLVSFIFSIQSIFVIFILSIYHNVYLFLIPLFAYMLSILSFAYALGFRTFESLPYNQGLVDYYEEDKSYQCIVNVMLGNYNEVIGDNEEIIEDKCKNVKSGLMFLVFGLVCTLISVIVFYLMV